MKRDARTDRRAARFPLLPGAWVGVWRAASAFTRRVAATSPALVYLLFGALAIGASSWLANTRAPVGPFAAGALAAARLVMLGLAYGGFALSLLREPPAWARRVAPFLAWPLLLWAIWTAPQGIGVIVRAWPRSLGSPRFYGSDSIFDQHYNAWLLLHGQNPYVGQRLTGVVAYFHTIAYTPLARGAFADPRHAPTRRQLHLLFNAFARNPGHPPAAIDPRVTHSYPAGSFLLVTPVVWTGAPSVAGAFIVACVALWLALIASAPSGWRWLAALFPLLMVDGLRQVGGGDFAILALALTLGSWLARDRRMLSVALLGVAVATEQTAWLAAPFALVWVWRALGWREAVGRGALVAGVFLLVNLPWIILSPGAWLLSMPLPYSLPFLPDGVGLVGLSLAGMIPLAPAHVYTALELVAYGALLLGAWRWWAKAPFLGIVAPLAPLLLAWRSPERYFELVPLAALTAFLVAQQALEPPQPGAASPMRGSGSSERRVVCWSRGSIAHLSR